MCTELSSRPRPSTLASRLGRVCVAGAVVSAVGLASTHPAAHAAGFAVTTTADGGAGSLRDAIDQANANPGPDTITVPAGTYMITLPGANEDSNATGDFDVSDDVTIVGAGAGSTIIDGDGLDRVFDIGGGTATLQHMTITNGSVPGGGGGNIIQRSGSNLVVSDSIVSNGAALGGAGISGGNGSTTILRSEIIDNVATSIPGNGSIGGAVSMGGSAQATLVITDSLLAGNTVNDGNGGAVYANANATITNTTITGNSGGARTVYFEAYNNVSLAASLTHVTIAGNTTSVGLPGGALYVNVLAPASMAVTVEGSLFQDNLVNGAEQNCATANLGAIVSEGNNLADDTSCTSFVQPSDQTNNDSTTLDAPADNGGPTPTMALLTGSSAIDAAGNCGAATATDQRGVSRPQGPACDVGAYEADVVVQPTTTTTTDPGTTTTTDPGTTTTTDPGTTTTTADPGTTTTTADPGTTTTTDLGSGGGTTTTDPFGFFTTTTVFHGGLPATGTNPINSLWLATLVCSLGGLLILGARRLAR